MAKTSCLVLKGSFKKFEKKLGVVPQPAFQDMWLDLAKISLHSRAVLGVQTARFYGRQGVDPVALATSIGETVQALVSTVDVADEKADTKKTDVRLKGALKGLAGQCHILLHHAYQSGRLAEGKASKTLEKRLIAEHKAYHATLRKSHKLAAAGDCYSLAILALDVGAHLLTETLSLVELAGKSSAEGFKKGACHGLQASDLARRWVLLLTSVLYLALSPNTEVFQKAAVSIKKTARLDMRLKTALVRPGAKEKTVKLKGVLNHVRYFKLPQKPFSVANLVGTRVYLMVPHKSMMRAGVTNGSVVWAVGKKTQFMKKDVFEVEFEGVAQHSKTYWEDYLAHQTRAVYNLYPAALRMIWEFPDIRRKDAISDLVSRIKEQGKK